MQTVVLNMNSTVWCTTSSDRWCLNNSAGVCTHTVEELHNDPQECSNPFEKNLRRRSAGLFKTKRFDPSEPSSEPPIIIIIIRANRACPTTTVVVSCTLMCACVFFSLHCLMPKSIDQSTNHSRRPHGSINQSLSSEEIFSAELLCTYTGWLSE